MKRYYYHGIGELTCCLWKMLEIIKSGELKTRNNMIKDNYEKYNHVCLYKKNESFDYNDENNFLHSALSSWIEHCWFFIISPEIPAIKTKYSNRVGFDDSEEPMSDIVDEWRSVGSIPFSKIVGIGIPFDSILEEEKRFGFVEDMNFNYVSFKEFYELLKKLQEYAKKQNWIIVNSDEKGICDKIDEQLNNSNLKHQNM